MNLTTVDFETKGIEQRPAYPPVPVGVSIKRPGERKSRYYAWGHPTENNCTKEEAVRVLRDVWRSKDQLAFQNAKFDIDVAETHLALKQPSWERIEDTLYLLFLHDPYAKSLSLKPSAEAILGMKPEEQNRVRTWVLANVPEAKRAPSTWGAYIWRAPGKLVGAYADGDVVRTEKLFNKLHPEVVKRGMQQAYDRERRLMPILLENERAGVRVDIRRMEKDYPVYMAALAYADSWLRKKLGVPNLNLDADRDVANALESSGVVTDFALTKKGNKSVSKKTLKPENFHNKQVCSVWMYRNMLSTCLNNFFTPWLDMARATDGRLFTTWNQVRQSHDEKASVGARTGRMSSTPSLMNVPKNWKKAMGEGFVPPTFLKNLPPLPIMRVYFLPDASDHWWGRRDYNQQELRILAHFEDGELMQQYNDDPRLDIHALVQTGIREIAGLDLPREKTKIMNFGEIYGMGLGEMAQRLSIEVGTAKRIKSAKRELLPGLAELEEGIKERGKNNLPIRTWGGREYYSEPPKFVEKYNRVMSFEYKLLNYLIQGSAADCTKESIIRYHHHPRRRGRFLVTVHDENNISANKKVFKEEMALMREVMQSVEFDVPMLSDGEYGTNWGTLEKFKEKAFTGKTAAHAAGK
jgi:DNA polymerase I-like protein with 3'-5' exonuclease and polymerase domains